MKKVNDKKSGEMVYISSELRKTIKRETGLMFHLKYNYCINESSCDSEKVFKFFHYSDYELRYFDGCFYPFLVWK
jgi:hypothetical protein